MAEAFLRYTRNRFGQILGEGQMPALVDDVWDWLDRAEQAREVAQQLTDPGAKQAVLNLAESYERLARAAVNPTVLRRRELAKQRREGNS
jgi:hypothetical protein